MKCEEFEVIGLDAERDASLSDAQRAAAVEHVSSCSHCAALQDRSKRLESTGAYLPARARLGCV